MGIDMDVGVRVGSTVSSVGEGVAVCGKGVGVTIVCPFNEHLFCLSKTPLQQLDAFEVEVPIPKHVVFF